MVKRALTAPGFFEYKLPAFPGSPFQFSRRMLGGGAARVLPARVTRWARIMLPHFKQRSWSDFPLRELVGEVAQSLAAPCKDRSIEVILDVSANLVATGNRGLIRRAVEHLMLGAIAAMPKGGSLWVTSAAGPNAIELEVADTGPTLSDEARRHAFDSPGDTERGAAGWELAMVYHIAKIHGGSVTAANCPEGGVAFTLRIPRRAALEAAA
jgi:signal transduction histidine kinase